MNLTGTTEILELVTSTSASTAYEVSWSDIDKSGTTTVYTPGSSEGTIAAATTTTIVAAPAASVSRVVTSLSIYVAGVQTVTARKKVGATSYGAVKATLAADESLHYEDADGWYALDANAARKAASSGGGTVTSVAATVPSFLSIAGSPITTSGTLAFSYSGTALPVANGGTGITAFGTGVATALGVNVGSAGAFVTFNGALGTPSSGALTNATGLPISTGVSGLGTGVATALAANVGAAGAFLAPAAAPTSGGVLGATSSTVPAWSTAPAANLVMLWGGAGAVPTGAAGIATDGVGSLTLTPAVGATALTISTATQTASKPVVDAAQAWNNAAVAFTAFKLNVTNTASNGASLLMDLQRDASSKFSVARAGDVVSASSISAATTVYVGQLLRWTASGSSNSAIDGRTDGVFQLANGAQSNYFYLSAPGVAIAQLGAANAASPVAQTLKAQGSRSGTDSNVAGANLTIDTADSTGNATPPSVIIRSSVAAASGTGAQTRAATLTVTNGAVIFPAYAVANLPAASSVPYGRVFVTDALTTLTLGIGTTIAAGGANKTPAWSDGTNWIYG